jgi:hypothetical protein
MRGVVGRGADKSLGHGHGHDHVYDHDHVHDLPLHSTCDGFVAAQAKHRAGNSRLHDGLDRRLASSLRSERFLTPPLRHASPADAPRFPQVVDEELAEGRPLPVGCQVYRRLT